MRQTKTPGQIWHALVRATATAGNRNNMIAQLTDMLLSHNVDAKVTHELLQCWNQARCSPPLDAKEVQSLVNTVCGLYLAPQLPNRAFNHIADGASVTKG
jgi:hypothetical protein